LRDSYSRNDPYSHDPYARRDNYGSNSPFTDPYFKRDAYRKEDAYSHHDPYSKKDPYGFNDPYALKDPYGTLPGGQYGESKSKPFMFWFWIKREIQAIFTAEMGLQDEKKVLYTDEDFYRLRVIGGIAIRGLVNLFLVPLLIVLAFVVMANVASSFRIIVFYMEILIVFFWFLFFPTWQVISAGSYAIYENVINLYKVIRRTFSTYLFKTILGVVIGILIVSIFAFKPELLHIKNKYIELFTGKDVMDSWKVIVFTNVGFLILFFVFFKLQVKSMIKKRKELIKANIINKKSSDFEKKASILDEGLEEIEENITP